MSNVTFDSNVGDTDTINGITFEYFRLPSAVLSTDEARQIDVDGVFQVYETSANGGDINILTKGTNVVADQEHTGTNTGLTSDITNFHHIYGEIDFVNLTVKCWVDGAQYIDSTIINRPASQGTVISIGDLNTGAGETTNFDGWIDGMRIANVLLGFGGTVPTEQPNADFTEARSSPVSISTLSMADPQEADGDVAVSYTLSDAGSYNVEVMLIGDTATTPSDVQFSAGVDGDNQASLFTTTDAWDNAGGTSNIALPTGLANDFDIVARIQNTSGGIIRSNTVNIDTTEPQALITNVAAGDTQLDIDWTSDSAEGQARIVVVTNGETAPSAQQVLDGQDNGGGAVEGDSGLINVTDTGQQDVVIITGLTNSTAYDVYLVQTDAHENLMSSPDSDLNHTPAGNGFTAAFVQGNGSTYFTADSTLPANATSMLGFTFYRMGLGNASSGRRNLWSADGNGDALYGNWDGNGTSQGPEIRGLTTNTVQNGSNLAIDWLNYPEEDYLALLYTYEWDAGQLTFKGWVWDSDSSIWSAEAESGDTETFSTSTAFNFENLDNLRIFARSDNAQHVFNGECGRNALWINPTTLPDIDQGSVRDNFLNATTGALIDPSVSQTAYGNAAGGLQFDFYTLAHYNSLSPDGALSGWTRNEAVNLVEA